MTNMSEVYRTIHRGGTGEIEEKKSRFIANVRPVRSEQEAQAFLEEMRKKYWDARHNCHAFVIGERNEVARSSDDGEPDGTAGHPMLDVLLLEKIHNVAVVVTRYFGGTLLGTGGLVRAYTAAVQAGLAASTILESRDGAVLSIDADYTDVGRLQYLIGQRQIAVLSSQYEERVRMEVVLPREEEAAFLTAVADATGGRAKVERIRETRYALLDGAVVEEPMEERFTR